MDSNQPEERKELSAEELNAVAGGAIQQPRNESAQPNPDPLPATGTSMLRLDELGMTVLPEADAEV